MVEVSDIEDRENLDIWLSDRPEATRQQEAVTLAHRAAMRVLPIYLTWIAGRSPEDDLTSLPVLWASLISGVASNASTPEIRKASSSSAAASSSSAAASASSSSAAASASSAAASASSAAASASSASAAASSASAAAAAASAAAAAASSAAAALWDEIRKDAARLVEAPDALMGPLWSDPDQDPFAKDWDTVLTQWQDQPTDWSFWINWANAIRTGTPQNQAMLTEIAIQDGYFWKGTDAEVNARIGGIWLKYAVAASPNAEVMSVNPDTQRLRVDPRIEIPEDHLAVANERLRRVVALFDFEGSDSNQYLPIKEEWKILDRAVRDYARWPLMLHSSCATVIDRLNLKISQGECPNLEQDANIRDLHKTVTTVAVSLFERDPAVKEAVVSEAAWRMPEAPEDMTEAMVQAAQEVAEMSEDVLAEQLPIQARQAMDPTTPAADRKVAFYVTASRLLRAWVLTGYRGTKTALAEVDEITKTVAGITKNVVFVTGVLAVASTPGWLQTAVNFIMGLF